MPERPFRLPRGERFKAVPEMLLKFGLTFFVVRPEVFEIAAFSGTLRTRCQPQIP